MVLQGYISNDDSPILEGYISNDDSPILEGYISNTDEPILGTGISLGDSIHEERVGNGALSSDGISLGEIIANLSTIFSAGAIILDKELPIIKIIGQIANKYLPDVYYKCSRYYIFPKISINKKVHEYRQLNWLDINTKQTHREGVINKTGTACNNIGFVLSMYTIFSDINTFHNKQKNNQAATGDYIKIITEITTFMTQGVDIFMTYCGKTKIAKALSRLGYAVPKSSMALFAVEGTTLSTIGQLIGAFLAGWELGKLIGKIPIPGTNNNTQYYIDILIDYCWRNNIPPINLLKDLSEKWVEASFAYNEWKCNRKFQENGKM